ncbi:MAG: ABC transporter permease [Alphaproteobacteria bacterium]
MMNSLWGFIKKEIIGLLRDPVLLFAILIMPAVQVVVLGQAISLEARNLKLAVDTVPNDMLISRIKDHALGSGWFIDFVPSKQSAIKAVQTGEADAALIAPKGGLTKAMLRNEGQIQILIDATNVLKAQSIEGYLRGIIAHVMQTQYHQTTHLPIEFSTRILFNPQLETQWFIVPAIMGILVFMSILTLVCISITKEKEKGTIETLISAPISKYDIILGKTLPFVLVALINMLIIQLVGVVMFKLPFVGSSLMFIASFIVFCVPACGVAVWLSVYTQTQQQAMLGLMIVAFLAMMLSGSMFPTENMPLVLKWIAEINPLTHFTYLLRNIVLKGADWNYFFEKAAYMLMLGFVLCFIAVKRFKTTL